jgi:peptidase S41-like protein
MSEKVYAWLLGLYPALFQKTYREEALQLFRDRKRDEKGLLPGLRLWADLLADLAISLPREYHRVQREVFHAAATLRLDGLPSFRSLEHPSPRVGALLLGSVLSLVTFGAVPHLVSQMGSYGPLVVSGPYHSPAQLQSPQGVGTGFTATAGDAPKLDATERQRVVEAIAANLKKYYVDPDMALKMAEALAAHQKAGEYNAVTEGPAFAELLTRQIRGVSHDLHLEVLYSQHPLPERLALYRKAMQENNCTFEKVEILPRQIGYLKLNSFPEVSVCGPTAKAAMARLNGAQAIIFDLRDNRGGYPGMVMLLAAYLFDHPEYFYNPRENTSEQSWTRSPVPGSRLTDKPVYVLTSVRTFSGAEHFSYNLKMLRRATLVGEKTGGATDVGIFHRLDDHFGMGIRETRAINPYSEPDWAVVGVGPDVNVKATDALKTAETLAEKELKRK